MKSVNINYSIGPKWDIIFSDIVDVLSLKSYMLARILRFSFFFFLSCIFFFFYYFLFTNVVGTVDNYCWGGLSIDSDFSDLFIWLIQSVLKWLFVVHNTFGGGLSYLLLVYFYFYDINYSLLLFFLDYVGLYWMLEFYGSNMIQPNNNLIYIYCGDLDFDSIYVLYNYNIVTNNRINIYLYEFVNYYNIYINNLDYRYLKIKAVVHSLFLINFWVDLLNYFYDMNFFKKLIFIQNLIFGIDFNLSRFLLDELKLSGLSDKLGPVLSSMYVSDLLKFNGVLLSAVINDLFIDFIDAQYLTERHFSRSFSVFNVNNFVLFLFKIPSIYFNFYSSIYYLCIEFIFIIKYLMSIYSLNILLYFEFVMTMVSYSFGHLTDIFCYLIFIFVIF